MSAQPAVRVRGLVKSYGEVEVLRGVDLDVAAGSIVALLGANGSGKTTTVRILATLLKADAGTATVAGFDVAAQGAQVRGAISLTGQFAAVDEILSGRENLVLVGRLRHLVAESLGGEPVAGPDGRIPASGVGEQVARGRRHVHRVQDGAVGQVLRLYVIGNAKRFLFGRGSDRHSAKETQSEKTTMHRYSRFPVTYAECVWFTVRDIVLRMRILASLLMVWSCAAWAAAPWQAAAWNRELTCSCHKRRPSLPGRGSSAWRR